MLLDMLMVFVIISIILFIFSVIMVEENPVMSIILIVVGMFFTAYCVFGFASVDIVLGDGTLYTDTTYIDAYSWGFFFFFIFYCLLFVKAGFNYVQQQLEKNEAASNVSSYHIRR